MMEGQITKFFPGLQGGLRKKMHVFFKTEITWKSHGQSAPESNAIYTQKGNRQAYSQTKKTSSKYLPEQFPFFNSYVTVTKLL
jgi:hypothetical protein